MGRATELDHFGSNTGTGLIPAKIETGPAIGGGSLTNPPPPLIIAWPPIVAFPPIIAPARTEGPLTNTSSFPIDENAVYRAKRKAFSEAGPRIWTPISNPPLTITSALASCTEMPADVNTEMICAPRAAPSPSRPYDETVTAGCPANLRKDSVIVRCCSNVRLRGATLASSFARSSRSDCTAVSCAASARAFASAICLSYPFASALADSASASAPAKCDSALAARSLESADSLIASAAWCCAADSNVLLKSWSHPSARDTNPSYSHSPAIPSTIKSQPTLAALVIHETRRCLGTNRRIGRLRRTRSHSRTDSASSMMTPTTTIPVQIDSFRKYASRNAWRPLLAASSSSCNNCGDTGIDTNQTDTVIWTIWAMSIIIGMSQGVIVIIIVYGAISSRRSSTSQVATKSDTSRTRSVIPAAIAGLVRRVRCTLIKL